MIFMQNGDSRVFQRESTIYLVFIVIAVKSGCSPELYTLNFPLYLSVPIIMNVKHLMQNLNYLMNTLSKKRISSLLL